MRAILTVIVSFVLLFGIVTKDALAAATKTETLKSKRGITTLVYMLANKTDGAFIDAARLGAAQAKREFGVEYQELRLRSSDDVLKKIDQLAKSGASPIISVGYQSVLPVLELAEKYPDTRFVVVDGLVPPLFDNVQSIIFKDHEGAFLVGMLAAYTSKTNKIGFIGGLNIPLIRNFEHGFKQGAAYVNSDIELLNDTVGDDNFAWSDNKTAYRLAKTQYSSGADIIFAAAGGAGLGVLKAAKDAEQLAIGVDANQNSTYPGYILTSMVKRVDVAVFKALEMIHHEQWEHGIQYLGLADGALDFTVDKFNHMLIDDNALERTVRAKEHIINGFLDVEMYSPR